jgi:hypothetical protein
MVMGLAIALAAILTLMLAGITVWLVISVIREPHITLEEQERADMRSMSWPCDSENR